METIESMGMMAGITRRWRERYQRWLELDALNADGAHRATAISKFVRYVQQSASLAVGAILAIQGEISAGAMIAANVLVGRALAPIDLLVGTWRPFLMARAAWHRLSRLLDAHPPRDPNLAQLPPQGMVQLKGVTALAEGRPQPILEQVSLALQPGRVLVVLGPSGSGKSTLARVLLGIWPRIQGEVLLDGRPLSTWDREVLGPRIGYLPQDVELLEGTVADNIARHGDPDPQRVIQAAQAAGLHEMLLRLPRGYDTPVGEIGQLLSGGQRQRLALARALYGEPELVVLDEPNANLDDQGERALAQSVQALRARGAAVVLITHRPNAIALADDLLVLEAGKVRYQGTRDAVLAQLQLARQAANSPNS
jgi:ATP-binding cassette subfamily C exporter for protease/lipase